MTISRRGFLGGMTAGVLACPAILHAGGKDRAAALAKAFLADHRVPGLSVAYLRGGNLRHRGAYGFADLAATATLTPAHRFRIASLSKPLTAAVVFELTGDGAFALDTPVFGQGGLLGPVNELAAGGEWLNLVTVEHLLAHRAGGWTNDGNDPMFQYPALPHAELIATTLSRARLQAEPGTSYGYSNFGYCLLGRIIEAATGVSYGEAVQARVLRRAGVDGFEIAGDRQTDRKPDEVEYRGLGGDAYGMPVARMDSHGGWIATAEGMARVFAAMDGRKGVPDTVRAATVAGMAKPGEPGGYYGHGLAINPAHGNRWHNGSLPGTTTLAVMVEGGNVMAGLVNGDAPGIDEALDALMWTIYGAVMG